MAKFREVTQNKYTGVEKPIGRSATGCDCVEQCGDLCRNVRMRLECGDSCKFGDNCINKRFQQKKYAKVSSFETGEKGKGLRAEQWINKNQFVIEYLGEIISHDEIVKRTHQYDELGINHQYIMSLRGGIFIDSTEMGNAARLINHSCDPNCFVDFWDVNCRIRVGIFAKREINEGEELTYDYKLETFGSVKINLNFHLHRNNINDSYSFISKFPQ